MYSVFDIKSRIYHPPMYCHNTGHATRMFTSIFLEPKTTINQFPDDFQVFQIGEFDDSNGKIKPLQNPELICSAADLINSDAWSKTHEKNNDDH